MKFTHYIIGMKDYLLRKEKWFSDYRRIRMPTNQQSTRCTGGLLLRLLTSCVAQILDLYQVGLSIERDNSTQPITGP